jgi:hypothetical protein
MHRPVESRAPSAPQLRRTKRYVDILGLRKAVGSDYQLDVLLIFLKSCFVIAEPFTPLPKSG